MRFQELPKIIILPGLPIMSKKLPKPGNVGGPGNSLKRRAIFCRFINRHKINMTTIDKINGEYIFCIKIIVVY